MVKQGFHDPVLSWSVFRRRAGDEILALIDGYFEVLATRGRSLTWNTSFPDKRKYYNAVYRLRKDGLIAGRGGGRGAPYLALTEEAEKRLNPAMKPERYWKKRWGGTWYILMYDVPESQRGYRDALRGFLTRMRMGSLQKSVWVSHRDIRGEFADLQEAAGVNEYAYLFEAQTLLGLEPAVLAWKAWSLDDLEQEQRIYCDYAKKTIDNVISDNVKQENLEKLAREEMAAYLNAMQKEPLLPSELYPAAYQGREAWDLHCDLVREIGRRL